MRNKGAKVPVEGNDPILALICLSTLVGILKGFWGFWKDHVTSRMGAGHAAPVHVSHVITLPVLDWHNGSRETWVTRDWELVGILKGFWGFWKNSAVAKLWPSAARRRTEAVFWRLASIPRIQLTRKLLKCAIWCGNCQKVRFGAGIAKKCDLVRKLPKSAISHWPH